MTIKSTIGKNKISIGMIDVSYTAGADPYSAAGTGTAGISYRISMYNFIEGKSEAINSSTNHTSQLIGTDTTEYPMGTILFVKHGDGTLANPITHDLYLRTKETFSANWEDTLSSLYAPTGTDNFVKLTQS